MGLKTASLLAATFALGISGAVAQTSPLAPPAHGKGDRIDIPLPSTGTVAPSPAPKDLENERNKARLDILFSRLKEAGNKRQADRIASHIMRRLGRSGSETVDILMNRATLLVREREFGDALDLLDGVVRLEPDFAEGWNRRATVHFMRGDFTSSLADIEEVLRREPRHWGALAGLSMILVATERKSEAIVVMNEALGIHPHLERMKERREQLILEVNGSNI